MDDTSNEHSDPGAGSVPQAPAGDPRGNAIRHGLTATAMLPQVLRSGRLEQIRSQLHAEFRPRTLVEEVYISEAARHAALLEVVEQAEPALLRQAAAALSLVASGQVAADRDDLLLSAAVSAEPLERVARYRRMHERALHQALDQLRTLQRNASGDRTEPAVRQQNELFATEEECQAYMRRRFSPPKWRCPKCHNRQGHWLESRQRWECAGCGRQIGLRYGTVFERSPLPLTVWFRAIRVFVGQTAISGEELAAATGIRRPATVRAMLRRLQQALDADDLEHGLAGLADHPLATGR